MTYELRKTDENVLIAEGASVTGDVRLAKGVSIWYGAVLRGDMGPITVGADTNIQDGAILHEETVVGRGCTIGHGAIVHGCTVGDGTLIGMHLRRVAVPVRLSLNRIGEANILCARTRPKLIGGERAKYTEED